ncbi:MAG: ribonuclease H family protein [Devosia sp.]
MNIDTYTGHRYVIACDGACLGNPGPGGWGVVIHEIDGDTLISRHALAGCAKGRTTNNEMELTAAIEGLRFLPETLPTIVISDSEYVVKGMNEWRHGWKERGWRKSNRKTVENLGLWMALDKVADCCPVVFRWVRGHNGDPMNEAADMLASNAAAGAYGDAVGELAGFHPELFTTPAINHAA